MFAVAAAAVVAVDSRPIERRQRRWIVARAFHLHPWKRYSPHEAAADAVEP